METIDTATLPVDWKDKIIPASLQQLGTDWANHARSPVLKVPSVVIEHEWNYVLNPRHPEFSKISWGPGITFSFDPRLLG
jgi:RES domain-containing protein